MRPEVTEYEPHADTKLVTWDEIADEKGDVYLVNGKGASDLEIHRAVERWISDTPNATDEELDEDSWEITGHRVVKGFRRVYIRSDRGHRGWFEIHPQK